MSAPHDPEVLVRLPASVRGRRRSAPKIERSSDVERTRGWLIGSLAGGLGLLAALLIDLQSGATIGPQHTISRPHTQAGLDCASCHGQGRPGPATAEHDPADTCVGCHDQQRSIRAPHASLLASKTMRCVSCHAIHTAEGGVAFVPGELPIRWRNGSERALAELEPLAGAGWPGREPANVSLIELAACSTCHQPSRATDPMAYCVLAGHDQPTDPVVCFDEHTPLLVAAGSERAALWELSREAAVLPAPEAAPAGRASGPWWWLGLSCAGALLGWFGTHSWARRRDRDRARASQRESSEQPGASLRPAERRRLPTIDATTCIGCSACVDACPYDVLELRAYVAIVARPDDCCGLTLCEQRCPNGSLIVTDGERIPELPRLDEQLAAPDAPGVYLAGDITGLPLIRNAINQGAHAVAAIAASLGKRRHESSDDYELVIVGAGPAGISAALEAERLQLRYVVLEQDSAAASIRSFPRGKLVFDQPLGMPMVGELWLRESSKEELLGKWLRIIRCHDLKLREGVRVLGCERSSSGLVVHARSTSDEPLRFACARVLLAFGRRGTPRKLDAPIAEAMLDHVHYSLADARSFAGRSVCVVGLGDVAIEAAIGLANQPGTQVLISYRGAEFKRGKRRNIDELRRLVAAGRVELRWQTEVVAVEPGAICLRTLAGEPSRHAIDSVFVMIGNLAPVALLEAFGVRTHADTKP